MSLRLIHTMLLRIALALFCTCFLLSFSQSQHFDEDWRWIHFTTESGLPSNSIFGVLETPDSTVWVQTRLGLAWYDGYQWHAIDNSLGIPRADYYLLVGVFHDSLMIGAGGGMFLGTKNGFRKLPFADANEVFPLSSNKLLFSSHGSLWVYDSNRIEPFEPSHELTTNNTLKIWKTENQTIWAHLVDGVYQLEGGKFQKKLTTTPGKSGLKFLAENLHGFGVTVIAPSSEQSGVWEWSRGSLPSHNNGEKPDIVRAMDVGPENEAIIVYQSGDVRIRRDGVWASEKFSHPEARDILAVKYRPNNDLWIATEHGLFLYRRSSSRWTVLKHESPDLRNTVNEILKARDGSLWLGTSDGIDVYRPDGSNIRISDVDHTPLGIVTGLAEDSQSNIWVTSGSSFTGAFRWDGKRWKHFDIGDVSEETRIHRIKGDRHGRLWFLGLGKAGPPVTLYQPGAFVLENEHFSRWSGNSGLLNGRVYSFAEGSDSSLWFGTIGGISRWKQGSWKYWTTKDGIKSGRVFCLAIDRNERVWFGDSSPYGLGYIGSDDQIHYFTTADGLVHDIVWDLRADSLGELWIATDGGLCSYNDGAWSIFDERTGLIHSSLWPVLPSGDQVYVGTRGKGVAILHREESATPAPKITIEQAVVEDRYAFLRWKSFSFGGDLEPGDIPTRYRLDDGVWSPWNNVHEAVIRSLDPGDHKFEIQAKGVFGNFDPIGAQGTITVLHPLVLRPVFYLPVGGSAVIVIFLVVAFTFRRIKHSHEIQRSEAKFRAVTENTSSAILIFQDDKILFVNPCTASITGYATEDLQHMRFTDLLHPEDRNEILEWLSERTGGTFHPRRFEVRIIMKSGDVRWIDVSVGWIRYQGLPVSLATAFDITERKEAEEALRESEERYRIVTELMSDYAYMDRVEEDGSLTVMWMTESFKKVTGYSVEEARAPGFIQRFIYPEDIANSAREIERLISGKPGSSEGRIITKQGEIVWLRHYAYPIFDKELGRVTYIYGIARNITERKRDEERLRSLASELALTEEKERRRMATYLHDVVVQTLAFAKMKIRLMQKASRPPEADQQLLEVRQLIDQAIKDSRSLTFELNPPILYELKFEVAIRVLAEHLLEPHKISFAFDDDAQPKPLNDDVRLVLFHSVREILVNAIKHAEAHEIKLSLSRLDHVIRISIQDDGAGYDRSTDSPRPLDGGFGLFNVRERLNYLGGCLDIVSAPGEGTLVTIQAPLKPDAD